jgi:hypothetical protein
MRIWGKNMNKKILLGNILSVVILILVSFTSVVGYNSVESDLKASPLFNIRSSRAIDEETNIQTCNYFGKGKAAGIPNPIRNSTYMLLYEVIDILNKMDKDEINKLIEFIKVHQDDITDYENAFKNIKNIDLNEVKQLVYENNIFNKGNFTSNLNNPICLFIEIIKIFFHISTTVIAVVFSVIMFLLFYAYGMYSILFLTACEFVTRCYE